MHLGLGVVLSSAVVLAAPGAITYGNDDDKNKKKITICHVPPANPAARHTITVAESAWPAHQRHGDHRGACGRRASHDRRFDEMDTDRDGAVTRGEWRGDPALFDRLDRNHDGVLSRAEFRRS